MGGSSEFESAVDPLTELQRLMAEFRAVDLPGLPPFTGGAVGYIGYDAVRFFEPTVGEPPSDQLGLPEMVFFVTDTFLVFDHRFRRLKIFANAFIDGAKIDEAYDVAAQKIQQIVDKLEVPTKPRLMNAAPVVVSLTRSSNTTREEFYEMVRKAKRHIEAGDIFQMVPSQRFEARFDGNPLACIERCDSSIRPLTCSACGLGRRFALVGSSPEVHVGCGDEPSRFVQSREPGQRAVRAGRPASERRTARRSERTSRASDACRSR